MKHEKAYNKPTLYVEGNVGVGKSTFLNFIKEHINVHVLYEPNHLWQDVEGHNLLHQFFLEPSRWSYTLQSYVLLTRIDQLLQADRQDHKDAVRIIERSMYSGRYCFAAVAKELGMMDGLEWCLYKKLWDRESVRIPQQLTGFIYLKASVEICYQRIMSRGRFEEKPIDLQYLKALEIKYDDWFIHKKGVDEYVLSRPHLILDFSSDLLTDKNMQEHYLQSIEEFIQKVQTSTM
ncbi:MAG TPA: deoxynucleoside kinase [Candidatus Saccharimonadales bacterium]|nr:deoxynucleoside kinase [Candidatus Saccharimonadales bacterium]